MTLVDIRRPDAFARAHVEGSLNIPAHAVEIRSFLRRKRLVLMGEGHSYAELDQLCRELPAAGFASVRVLDNGVSGWRDDIGPLIGTAPGDPSVDAISPLRYERERAYDHWLEVVVSGSVKTLDRSGVPDTLLVPAAAGAARVAIRETKAALERAGARDRLVLIVHDDADAALALARAARDAGIPRAFALAGGQAAWARHAAMKHAVSRHVPMAERKLNCVR